jgi:hypothetical protein
MKTFIKTLLITSFVFFALPLFAAELQVETSLSEVVGQKYFLADVFIQSDDSINALEGTFIYSSNLLKVKEIQDGNSVINFWIEKPSENKIGEISFSGITPGGFMGDKPVFSVIFEATNLGEARLGIRDAKVLLNDGEGSLAETKVSGKIVSISKIGGSDSLPEVSDLEMPEDFIPLLANDPNLFDGKYFLVFSTEDKISGIDYYQLREGKSGEFKKVESPHLLKNQSLSKTIFIQAVDKKGNTREVILNLIIRVLGINRSVFLL